MPRFEYRLNGEAQGYSVVYFYEDMNAVEAAMRFGCDYFIKEGKTYLKTASAVEPPNYVVYVEAVDSDPSEDANTHDQKLSGGIAFEVREYREGSATYPLVHQCGFANPLQALPYILADTMILFGQEWGKTSIEIDEDRQAYIYYCKKTGG